MKKTDLGAIWTLVCCIVLSTSTFAKIQEGEAIVAKGSFSKVQQTYITEFNKMDKMSNKDILAFKDKGLKAAGVIVPVLTDVMKTSAYSDKARWVATLLLGRIMGKKASPFIAKFLDHPNWVLRMASLKTFLALKDKTYVQYFSKSLNDNSFMVRTQALENIRKMNLTSLAPSVWQMVYDEKNYYNGNPGSKRMPIFKDIVKTLGELKYQKVKNPLVSMIVKSRYEDIFEDLNLALENISGVKAPKGEFATIRKFWKKNIGI